MAVARSKNGSSTGYVNHTIIADEMNEISQIAEELLRLSNGVMLPTLRSHNKQDYLDWLDQVDSAVTRSYQFYSSAFNGIARAIGRNPVDIGEDIISIVSTKSQGGRANELFSRVGQVPVDCVNADLHRAVALHDEAEKFIFRMWTDPIAPLEVQDTVKVGPRAGEQKVSSMHIASNLVGRYGDPYYGGEWQSCINPTAAYVALPAPNHANQCYGANSAVTAGKGVCDGVIVYQPEGCQSYLTLFAESSEITFTIEIGNFDGETTTYTLRPQADAHDINTVSYTFPLPEGAITFRFNRIVVPNNGDIRITWSLSSYPISNRQIVFTNNSGELSVVPPGTSMSDIFNFRKGGTDNSALFATSFTRAMGEADGMYAAQKVLRIFVELFGSSRQYDGSLFETGNPEYYWDPSNWDRFVRPNANSKQASVSLISMAYSDILVSRMLCITNEEYLKGFTTA
jgi:hypothetical protein